MLRSISMDTGAPYGTKTSIVDTSVATASVRADSKRNTGGSSSTDTGSPSFISSQGNLNDNNYGFGQLLEGYTPAASSTQTIGRSPRDSAQNLGASPIKYGGAGENSPKTLGDVPMSNALKLIRRNSILQLRTDEWKCSATKSNRKHVASERCIQRLRHIFETLDTDYDGFLTTEQLNKCYTHANYPNNGSDQRVMDQVLFDCIRQSRLNGDDILDYEEFVDFMLIPQETFCTRHWTKLIFLAVMSWFLVAPLVYCNFNRKIKVWSFWDALYFSAATVTTVGYGDYKPDSDAMKLFTVAYIFSGLVIVSRVINEFADYLVRSYDRHLRTMDLEVSGAFMNTFSKREERKSRMLRSQRTASEKIAAILGPPQWGQNAMWKEKLRLWASKIHQKVREEWVQWSNHNRMVIQAVSVSISLVFLPIVIGTIFAYHNENWTFVDSLYWTCVTVTSVGYGDLLLKKESSRIFAIFFILFGFACLGAAIGRIARLKIELRCYHKKKRLLNRSLSVNLLMDMDQDGNGVDKCEFVCAMLLQMDKVTNDDLRPLLKRFDELDVDKSGFLTRVDIEIMRKQWREQMSGYKESKPQQLEENYDNTDCYDIQNA